MAADNVQANASTTQGAIFRTFSDGANEWPAGVCCYVVSGSAGAWVLQQVDATHGLPVSVLGTVPVSGTFWQATQPVSAASLPLPTGAATAAKQPAIGTAGTASADVLTVQGIASMTALKVDGSAVTQPVSGTVTANQGGSWSVTVGAALPAGANVIGGVELVDSAGVNKASISAAGAVKVDGSAATQPISGTVTANAGTGTFAVSGTVTANAGTGSFTVVQATASNLQAQVQGAAASGAAKAGNPVQVGGVFNTTQPTVTTGQAVEAQCTARGAQIVATGVDVFHATIDNSTIAVTQSGGWTVTANAGTGTFAVSGTVTANIGTTNGLALDATLTGGTQKTKIVDSGGTNVASVSAAGAVKVDGSAVTQPVSGTITANVGTTNGLALDATLTGGTQKAIPVAAASGGATPYHLVSAATNNATSVKASAGTVYDVQCFNTNASPRYLKFYDKASTPSPATDTPVKVVMMPGNASGAGATAAFPVGVNFTLGIAIAIVAGIGDTDNTAVGANDCVISFNYK